MNLMRKAAMTVLALSATTAFAGHSMYYGAGFGFSQNNSAINSQLTIVKNSDSTISSKTNSSSITGGEALQGFGFVGISGSLTDMIRGSIQADLGFDGLSKNVKERTGYSHTAGTVNLQSGLYYGASARLSVIRGDYAPYLLAGVRSGTWSATRTFSQETPSYSVTSSKTMVAPELGVGINFTVSDMLDGRMEYKYMFGSTTTATSAPIGITYNTAASTVVAVNSLSPRQQSLQFSLVF